LIYPLHAVDIFSFDWKMPKGTAILQQAHIYYWAEYMFSLEISRALDVLRCDIKDIESIGCLFNMILAVIVLISPFFITYRYLKKKISKERFYLYLLIVFCIIFSMVSAPDFRFIYGYVLGTIFLLAFRSKRNKEHGNKVRKISLSFSMIIMIGFCFVAGNKFIEAGERIGTKLESVMDFVSLYHHRNSKNINNFEEYQMGNQIIYINKERWDNRTFDLLPATDPHGIPFEPFTGLRIQAIETIELRGNSLQDGFRTKKEYINIINNNIEKYKAEYMEYKGLKKFTGPED